MSTCFYSLRKCAFQSYFQPLFQPNDVNVLCKSRGFLPSMFFSFFFFLAVSALLLFQTCQWGRLKGRLLLSSTVCWESIRFNGGFIPRRSLITAVTRVSFHSSWNESNSQNWSDHHHFPIIYNVVCRQPLNVFFFNRRFFRQLVSMFWIVKASMWTHSLEHT